MSQKLVSTGYKKTADVSETALFNGSVFLFTTASLNITGTVVKNYSITCPSSANSLVILQALDVVSPTTAAWITIATGSISSSYGAGFLIGSSSNFTESKGTTLTAYNTNQNSARLAGVRLTQEPTFLAAGVQSKSPVPTTSSYTTIWQGRTESGSLVFGDPVIALKGGSQYEVRITNLGSDTNVFNTRIQWIEKRADE
jgi:hypothetical protein